MLSGLGWQELLVIFAILMLLFGAKRVPQMAEGLASSIKSFRKSLTSETE